MAEQRLIDANEVRKKIKNSRASKSVKVESLVFVDCAPTIEPETLPIVRNLREKLKNEIAKKEICGETIERLDKQLEKVTAERNAAVNDLRKLVPAWKWDGLQEDENE